METTLVFVILLLWNQTNLFVIDLLDKGVAKCSTLNIAHSHYSNLSDMPSISSFFQVTHYVFFAEANFEKNLPALLNRLLAFIPQ